jgi:phosphatidyl-myo-inositol dimannoside synthase
MTHALILTPSRGLGGGIERYAETLEWAFGCQGVEYMRVDLARPGFSAHARLLAQSRALLRESSEPIRLVLVHRALLPAAALLARHPAVSGTSVVCHGSDVWAGRLHPRSHLENHLMRQSGVRVITVSSFTSGALSRSCQASVLPPGLSDHWFNTLLDASARPREPRPDVRVVTAFRLDDWRQKGLPQLLEAVAALGADGVRLTVCGTGEPPADLRQLVGRYRWCCLRPGLDDASLAGELADADLFVLATRTRCGRRPSGEGFGLVLLEAQVAGTAVVGPAFGGSHDAFVDHVTGLAPADETAGALAAVLADLLRDRARLERMGKHAAEWARRYFLPQRYAARAVACLLSETDGLGLGSGRSPDARPPGGLGVFPRPPHTRKNVRARVESDMAFKNAGPSANAGGQCHHLLERLYSRSASGRPRQ